MSQNKCFFLGAQDSPDPMISWRKNLELMAGAGGQDKFRSPPPEGVSPASSPAPPHEGGMGGMDRASSTPDTDRFSPHRNLGIFSLK